MNAHRLAAASALIACALSANVHAEVLSASASVSITNLTFTLIDLDPADGVAPAAWVDVYGLPRFQLTAQEATLGRNGQWTTEYRSDDAWGDLDVFIQPALATVSTATGQALSALTPSAITTQASTSLDTAAPERDFKKVAESELVTCCSVSGAVGTGFDLRAKSAIRLTGDYSLFAQLQPGPTQANQALAWLEIGFGGIADYHSLIESASASQGGSLSAAKSGSFDFIVRNNTTLWQSAYFGVFTKASAVVESRVSPVPEPQTIVLMLAGLGVVASARRQQHI